MTTPFDACLTALRQPGPPEALFKVVDQALAETVGHKLFTLLYVAPDGKRVKRLYTNMPKEYPVGGYKPVTESDWHKRVIGQRRAWVGFTYEDVKWAFFDHELIRSLGCESAMNVPVVYAGRVLGTMNLLDEAGHYKEADAAKGRALRRPDDRPVPRRHRRRSGMTRRLASPTDRIRCKGSFCATWCAEIRDLSRGRPEV